MEVIRYHNYYDVPVLFAVTAISERGFQVVKSTAMWDVMPCSLAEIHRGSCLRPPPGRQSNQQGEHGPPKRRCATELHGTTSQRVDTLQNIEYKVRL
jgi:hypothetical protein